MVVGSLEHFLPFIDRGQWRQALETFAFVSFGDEVLKKRLRVVGLLHYVFAPLDCLVDDEGLLIFELLIALVIGLFDFFDPRVELWSHFTLTASANLRHNLLVYWQHVSVLTFGSSLNLHSLFLHACVS